MGSNRMFVPIRGLYEPGLGIPMKNDTVAWIPLVDFYEIEKGYVLNAELPGVERSDIKIELSGDEVTIKGERCYRNDTQCAKESFSRLEGHRGKFHRTFLLPHPVDRDSIQVNLQNGVLNLVFSKISKKND